MNNFLQGLQTLLGLGQHPAPTASPAAAARTAPMMPPYQHQPLQQLQPLAPMQPHPVNGQVSPQLQAIYQAAQQSYLHALNRNGQFTRPQAMSVGQTNQSVNAQQFPQLNQGGQFNPGLTPLQNSGFGPGGRPQIQAFNSPQQQNFDPQQGINLY